jgi:hypothetical protein
MPICPNCKQEFKESLETMTDMEKTLWELNKKSYQNSKLQMKWFPPILIFGIIALAFAIFGPKNPYSEIQIGGLSSIVFIGIIYWVYARKTIKLMEINYEKIGMLQYLKE